MAIKMRKQIFALLALISCLPMHAAAENFCVGNTGQLFAALTAAAQSAEASAIRIRAGTYVLTARLNYNAASDLHLSGGWQGASGSCTSQIADPDVTYLTGPANTPVLRAVLPSNGSTSFTVTGLTLAGFVSLPDDQY